MIHWIPWLVWRQRLKRLKTEVCAGGGEVSAQLLAAIVWNHKSSHNFGSMFANFGEVSTYFFNKI